MNRGKVAFAALVCWVVWGSATPAVMSNELAGPTCVLPDLTAQTPVPLQFGAEASDPTDDPIPGGRWELIDVFYSPTIPVILTGEARSAFEFDASGPASGTYRTALDVDISAPVMTNVSQGTAGPYSAAGGVLTFTNECIDPAAVGDADYRIGTSGEGPTLTVWTTLTIQGQFPFDIDFQTVYLLVEPQVVEDPIYDDRFELP